MIRFICRHRALKLDKAGQLFSQVSINVLLCHPLQKTSRNIFSVQVMIIEVLNKQN